jgi:hypothetical protein
MKSVTLFGYRLPGLAFVASSLLLLGGCHSAYIEATVHNATGGPVSVVEVDYPSASFGKESLPDGADFHYRFKVLGSGATKVLWTDANHHDHTVAGPSLQEGAEGRLLVTLTSGSATWDVNIHPAR